MDEQKCVVVAWTRYYRKPKEGSRGFPHGMHSVVQPYAAVWILRGNDEDVTKANAFVAKENEHRTDPDEGPYRVFVYPRDEKDPLADAKMS